MQHDKNEEKNPNKKAVKPKNKAIKKNTNSKVVSSCVSEPEVEYQIRFHERTNKTIDE